LFEEDKYLDTGNDMAARTPRLVLPEDLNLVPEIGIKWIIVITVSDVLILLGRVAAKMSFGLYIC
jgi:hypothetical protein